MGTVSFLLVARELSAPNLTARLSTPRFVRPSTRNLVTCSYWGEDGFMRIVKGENNIAIESDCAWVTPKKTW